MASSSSVSARAEAAKLAATTNAMRPRVRNGLRQLIRSGVVDHGLQLKLRARKMIRTSSNEPTTSPRPPSATGTLPLALLRRVPLRHVGQAPAPVEGARLLLLAADAEAPGGIRRQGQGNAAVVLEPRVVRDTGVEQPCVGPLVLCPAGDMPGVLEIQLGAQADGIVRVDCRPPPRRTSTIAASRRCSGQPSAGRSRGTGSRSPPAAR